MGKRNKWSGKRNGDRYDIEVEIMRELSEYTEEVSTEIEKAARRLSRQAVAKLKQTSPRSTKEHKHYADSWTSKTVRSDGKIEITIYNKAKPGLTHLLEHGFINDKTGRRTKPHEHIEPVQEELSAEFEKACEDIIKNT